MLPGRPPGAPCALLVLLLAATAGPACSRGRSAADGGAPDAGSDRQAPSPAPSAGPQPTPSPTGAGAGAGSPAAPTPGELPVQGAVAILDGDETPLARSTRSSIDPGASFRVELGTDLVDGRLALYDAVDALVPASGEVEVGAASTRYQLTPLAPLRPGSTYALVVDGDLSQVVHDRAGRAFRAAVLEIQTTGERPDPADRERLGPKRPRRSAAAR